MDSRIRDWRVRALAFQADAHQLFARYEGSASRVVELRTLTKRLAGLPLDVESYFSEAVECLERNLKRSATVMSWAGFFSIFSESLYLKHEADIRSQRPKWNFVDENELRESYPEAQIIEVARLVKFIKQGERRKYDGQLATRNQCAHPTVYQPSLNEAIGFVDTMVSQTQRYL